MRHCEGVRSHASLRRAHTRLPLSSATWAHFCISGNRPRAVDSLRQREGHWQPTSVTALGGPAASIQLRQGPCAAGGPRESAHCPARGPHIARWAARCAAAAAAGLQPAKHAAGGLEPTPGRCCGLGPRASPSHRTGDWARVPARTALAGMFVTDPQTARGLRLVYAALPSTTTVLAQVSRSRCKLWPRLRSAKAPWGFLRVRL